MGEFASNITLAHYAGGFQPYCQLVLTVIVHVDFHPCYAGAADMFAPQVWMVDPLYPQHHLPELCPLQGS